MLLRQNKRSSLEIAYFLVEIIAVNSVIQEGITDMDKKEEGKESNPDNEQQEEEEDFIDEFGNVVEIGQRIRWATDVCIRGLRRMLQGEWEIDMLVNDEASGQPLWVGVPYS